MAWVTCKIMSASMVLAWEELSESSEPSLWTSEIKIWAAVNGHSQNPLGLCSFLPSYLKYSTIIFPGAHVSVNKWFLLLASNSTHCKHIQNLSKLYVATHVHSHPSLSNRDSSQPGLSQSSRSVTLPLEEDRRLLEEDVKASRWWLSCYGRKTCCMNTHTRVKKST